MVNFLRYLVHSIDSYLALVGMVWLVEFQHVPASGRVCEPSHPVHTADIPPMYALCCDDCDCVVLLLSLFFLFFCILFSFTRLALLAGIWPFQWARHACKTAYVWWHYPAFAPLPLFTDSTLPEGSNNPVFETLRKYIVLYSKLVGQRSWSRS